MSQTLRTQPEPTERQAEYRNALGSLATALGASPVSDESQSCRLAASALRAATNVVFLALAGEPPFDEYMDAPAVQTLTSMRAGIEPARAAVLAVGAARWPHYREAAGSALQVFADLLSAGDCDRTLPDHPAQIRFQAERLTRTDALSFGQVRWIKSSLVDALDGLDLVVKRTPVEQREENVKGVVSDWRVAARKAVATIDAEDLLAFQRSAIQDAFRATLDAFTRVARTLPECRK